MSNVCALYTINIGYCIDKLPPMYITYQLSQITFNTLYTKCGKGTRTYIYIYMYITYLVIDIIIIDLLTDIPRQVVTKRNWPTTQSRMMQVHGNTVAKLVMPPAKSWGLLNHREFVVMVGGQDLGILGTACWAMDRVDHWNMDELQVWC